MNHNSKIVRKIIQNQNLDLELDLDSSQISKLLPPVKLLYPFNLAPEWKTCTRPEPEPEPEPILVLLLLLS